MKDLSFDLGLDYFHLSLHVAVRTFNTSYTTSYSGYFNLKLYKGTAITADKGAIVTAKTQTVYQGCETRLHNG
jgi:hypothetical protein